MGSILVIAIVALLAAGGYWSWSRQRRALDLAHKPERPAQRFASVRIRVGYDACKAAQSIVDEPFLANQAPRLPLPDCTSPQCECSFQKLSDRRAESRRWADEGIGAAVFSAAERRAVPGRRDID